MIGHFSGPSENNPYAWDDDFSYVQYSVTAATYQDILFYSKIFHNVCFAIGTFLSLLLLYLIFKKNGKMLQNYRTMLIFNCFVDMQICLAVYLGQYSTKAIDNLFMSSFDGIGQHLGFTGQCALMSFFTLSINVVITSLPANYYYRYICIKRGRPLSFCGVLLLYSIVYAVTLPTMIWTLFSFHYDGLSRPGFNYGSLWFNVKPLPTILILNFHLPHTKFFMIYVFICYGIAYSLSISFAVKTWRILGTDKAKYSQRTLQMQTQLSVAMLVQAILPVFISLGPSVLMIIEIAFGFNWDIVTTIAFNAFALIPVLNSLCTILVIRPFREAVMRPFLKTKPAVSRSSVT
ncbi:unnamed protein product [Bursaphelenchus xylophilus]|uniref:(pine wood nematode) hypothetical protein n=1 Tax=Bursaphelenchus xylophilus TaxID=6326 RepID=A0A1I7RKG9_BURXY|nr:unnamed protein product [Bursaphelenchus xylophilus]CAG9131332.1 unnamed protein product [Bursaphelenchus xylophilus]